MRLGWRKRIWVTLKTNLRQWSNTHYQCLSIHTEWFSHWNFSSTRRLQHTCLSNSANWASWQDAAAAFENNAARAHLAWANLPLQRCRSRPACSASAPLPRPVTPAMTTARRASGAESGCTAASGSGRSCSCRGATTPAWRRKMLNVTLTRAKSLSSAAPHSASESEVKWAVVRLTWSRNCWINPRSEISARIWRSSQTQIERVRHRLKPFWTPELRDFEATFATLYCDNLLSSMLLMTLNHLKALITWIGS